MSELKVQNHQQPLSTKLPAFGYSVCRKFLLFLMFFHTSVCFVKADDGPIPLVEVPYDLINNRVQLTLKIAETKLKFLLDTGASRTVLFQTSEHSFSALERTGKRDVIFPALDEIVAGVTLGPTPIQIGSHTFTPRQVLLILERIPVGDRLSFKFDGILGQDFFRKHAVEVNPKTKILRLYKPGTKLKKYFRTRLKLNIVNGAPHIKFINKFPWEHYPKPKELLLDTGYPGSMVIWKDRHFRRAAGNGRADELKKGNIGVFARATFAIGDLRFNQAPIFLAAHEPKQASKRDGLLGSNVLSQFHHFIDFKARQLSLSIVGVHRAGVDGAYYVPNNEDYIIRNFPETNTSPTLVIE